MKTKILILGILVAFATNFAYSQSLESQLKIIFGDVLQDSKYKEARILGRALSTLGNMKYNMELIQARNNYNVTVNIPANTHLDQNNQVVPNLGYQWYNPNDPSDFRLIPTGSRATLPSYDLNYLAKKWWLRDFCTLNLIFTYGWYADINGDGSAGFSEFNNKKRTFYREEQINFLILYSSRDNKEETIFSKQPESRTLNFLIQLFNATNGSLIVRREIEETNIGDKLLLHFEPLGNMLPPGKYLIAVSMGSPEKLKSRTVTFLQEYFEVIE